MLWVNLALLFFLSLVPFVIRWIDEGGLLALPVAAYGVVVLLAGVSYVVLQRMLVACNGPTSPLRTALGRDRKSKASLVGYACAIPLAFLAPGLSIAIYILIAGLWLVPDRRIERSV